MECPICNETHALIAVISPTDAVLYRCSECGELGTAKVWEVLREVEQWKADYYVASKLVADLYEAVTGNTGEPIRGVVEDVQDTIEK